MLDIKYIRENADKIQEAAKNKNINIDIPALLDLDVKRKKIMTDLDNLRARRNELALVGKGGRPTDEQIAQGKKIKEKISILEEDLNKISEDYENFMVKVPTIPSADTPIGKSEKENLEIYKWGNLPKFDFKPKDYIALSKDLDLIDYERGVKVAGYRGYYFKNEAAEIAMALMMFGLDRLIKKGFTPMIPPVIVREFALFGSGYFSGRKYNPEIDEIYKIENSDKDLNGKSVKENKFLIGTAEPSLLAYYSNEILNEKDLPMKICGFSPCFRSEIGSYGKDTKGIYRVHEFMKIEQVCICPSNLELAEKMHQEMLNITKEIHEELGLPYRILQICTGDMAAGKYKMFDIEAWMPSRNSYGETGSASNFLDWQARRLNVKYKDKNGNKKFVFMLNNTAITSVRPTIAILENNQQKDGSVKIPEVLRKYLPSHKEIIK